MVENTGLDTAKKQRQGFKKGISGNPNGRPKGSRNKTTIAVQELLQGEAEALTRAAIKLALNGDTTALRLCLERILPAVKETPVNLELPSMESLSDLPKVTAALISAVSSGSILPGEAEKLGKIIDNHIAALELVDIDTRLKKLELQQEENK